MFGFNTLRRFIDRHLYKQLRYNEGDLLFVKKEGRDTIFTTVSFERKKYWLGVIPVYGAESALYLMSYLKDIFEPLTTNLQRAVRGAVSNSAPILISGVVNRVAEYLYPGIEVARKRALVRIAQEYPPIHESWLKDFVKSDRNAFRQKLAEIVKTTAVTVMTSNLQRHIGMFLIKVREYASKQVSEGYTSSGSCALPAGTRFVFHKKDASVFVIEQAPRLQTISYFDDTFRIALPYVVFIAALKDGELWSLHLFFRTSPLENEADDLLCPGLPNVHEKIFKVCFSPSGEGSSPREVVERAIQDFWGSTFNNDLRGFFNVAQSQFPQISTLEQWQESSKKDSQFVLRLKWQSAQLNASVLSSGLMNDMLNVKKAESGADSVDALQEYAGTIAERFSRELSEKIHFMLVHSNIELDSLKPAHDRIASLVTGVMSDLRSQLDSVLVTPRDSGEISALCVEIQQKVVDEIDRACASVTSPVIRQFVNL